MSSGAVVGTLPSSKRPSADPWLRLAAESTKTPSGPGNVRPPCLGPLRKDSTESPNGGVQSVSPTTSAMLNPTRSHRSRSASAVRRRRSRLTSMTHLMLTKGPAGNGRPSQEVASSGVTRSPRHHEETSFSDGRCSALGWLSSTAGRVGVLMLDRVTERSRAAQLARHYRDQEGLSIAEIARRLGRAQATIKAYLYDPTGDKASRGQGALPGSVSRLRGAHRATERQGRRLRVLQTLPSRRDCAAMDPGTGSRGDARLASALRRCAVVLRLVAHPRTRARRRGAETTISRRMARAVHRHRSVCELGGGRRGRLRRRLSVRASMPLTYERGLALHRL